jgi:hypothetical protein
MNINESLKTNNNSIIINVSPEYTVCLAVAQSIQQMVGRSGFDSWHSQDVSQLHSVHIAYKVHSVTYSLSTQQESKITSLQAFYPSILKTEAVRSH